MTHGMQYITQQLAQMKSSFFAIKALAADGLYEQQHMPWPLLAAVTPTTPFGILEQALA